MGNLSINRLEENYGYVACMCGIYGVIFTFCLYQNLSGITFPLCVAATIVTSAIFLKKMGITIRKNFLIYVIGMMLLGVSTTLTSNGFFHFFNWAGILLLLMTAMLQQLNEQKMWSFQKYIVLILILEVRIIISVCDPFIHAVRIRRKREKKENKYFKSVILGLCIAMILLIIVLPLLIGSDKVFARYFGDFMKIFQFGNEFGIFFTFLLGFVLMYALFSALSALKMNGQANPKGAGINPVTGITFTVVLAVIYITYSMIQILFLFLRFGSGLPANVTYSEYAHSGFWQLLVVSFINFITVLICISVFAENKVLKILLMIISVCTCIMALSAAYRMILYVGAYYLTFLRVLVLWFLGVLLLIMGGVMWSILKRKFRLFRYIMVVVAVCYIGLSFAKVDRSIAEYNVKNWKKVELDDVLYLTEGTSIDAAPVIAENSDSLLQKNKENDESRENLMAYFKEIDGRSMSLRSWNFSAASAKKAAKEYIGSHTQ